MCYITSELSYTIRFAVSALRSFLSRSPLTALPPYDNSSTTTNNNNDHNANHIFYILFNDVIMVIV